MQLQNKHKLTTYIVANLMYNVLLIVFYLAKYNNFCNVMKSNFVRNVPFWYYRVTGSGEADCFCVVNTMLNDRTNRLLLFRLFEV